jgi:hypothetical protein
MCFLRVFLNQNYVFKFFICIMRIIQNLQLAGKQTYYDKNIS